MVVDVVNARNVMKIGSQMLLKVNAPQTLFLYKSGATRARKDKCGTPDLRQPLTVDVGRSGVVQVRRMGRPSEVASGAQWVP